MTRPNTVIGLPLYNGGDHVVEALESLLAQTYPDFALVIVDDCSTDRTFELVAEYATGDVRIHLTRNETRLGLIANWRRTFHLARELKPDLEYFAWASDHDIWHPRWLESVIAELDEDPEAVAAYPRTGGISQSGEMLLRDQPSFDTAEVGDARVRAELTWKAGAFGSRVYALFRARALERCGVFRFVYLPDRLLLVEMALQGRFREVPEVLLWRRRRTVPTSFERQRAASLAQRRAPLRFHLPWVYVHSLTLFSSLALHGRARPALSRRGGASFAARYLKLARAARRASRGRASP